MFPETSVYVKRYNGETKQMYFLIEYDELLKKCNDNWNKFSSSIKKTLTANPSTTFLFSEN